MSELRRSFSLITLAYLEHPLGLWIWRHLHLFGELEQMCLLWKRTQILLEYLNNVKKYSPLPTPPPSPLLSVPNPPASAGAAGWNPGWGRSCGVGNGNPLQYCLKNSIDSGAWWSTVREVAKSLSRLSTHTHTPHHPLAFSVAGDGTHAPHPRFFFFKCWSLFLYPQQL